MYARSTLLKDFDSQVENLCLESYKSYHIVTANSTDTMVVDLGLVVPPDKSFPSDHNALAEFVLSEYANLPMEQKQRFQEIPKPITSDSSANTCEALTEETERALRDFMSTYNTRKDSAANTKITVVPPLHQLIDLTHYVVGALEP